MRADSELVDAVLAGDRSAFSALVARYKGPVRATALAVLKHHHSAEDIEQEAFVMAFQKLGTLRSSRKFGPWLLQITRRLALSAARRQRTTATLDPETAPAAPNNGQLESDLQKVLAAVMKLPETERQAVMLRYFNGHGVQEIADMTSQSVGTVTKRLTRARQRLRGWLEETES